MQFLFDGEFYKAIKITGPKHNLLGLRFTSANDIIKKLEVIALQKDKNSAVTITVDEVKNQVMKGLDEINEELNTNYKIIQIQFIPSDTASTTVYKELTKEIVKQLVTGNGFQHL